MKIAPCPNCGGNQLFRSKEISAGGGHAPNYLPALGTWFQSEKFHLVICRDCGLTRFFARPSALEKLAAVEDWKKI